jgi:phosphatidylglycerol:prolipoprotein diacylglycerol transferase
VRRVLFSFHGVTVWSYPALLYLGLVAAVVAENAAAHAAHIDALRAFVAMQILVVAALVGARVLYIVTHWRFYRREPRRIWDRRDGGAAMYGGLPVTLALSAPLLAALGVPFGAFWDTAVIAILVGMIFTRAGCLLNGCCAGRPTRSWVGVKLPDHAGHWRRRFPTQLFEAAWACALLCAAAAVWRRLAFPGALFLCVAGGYAAGRLALESLRDPPAGARRLTLYHVLSGIVVAASVAILAARWPR